MRLVFLWMAAVMVQMPPVHAGAWLQSEGKAFLSVENGLRVRDTGLVFETDIFFEYGLTPRLSVGLSLLQNNGVDGHLSVFMKKPLGRGDRPFYTSLQLDLGVFRDQRQLLGLSKVTFAYGRGFRWGDGHGWMNIDTAIEYRMGAPSPFFKLDGTLGQSTGARIRPMFKVSLTQIKSQPLIWSISPNLLFDTKGKVTWTLGLERKNDGDLSNALKFGLWRSF